MSINWNDPKAHISPHFTVKEALLLPSWGIYHNPTYTEKAAIQIMAGKMEGIRAVFGQPISVHCWIRPEKADLSHPANGTGKNAHDGENYNADPHVKGSPQSMHRFGRAVDFHVKGYEGSVGCREVRLTLLPLLEPMGLRMEDIEGGWVHVDNGPVGASGRRFFRVA